MRILKYVLRHDNAIAVAIDCEYDLIFVSVFFAAIYHRI